MSDSANTATVMCVVVTFYPEKTVLRSLLIELVRQVDAVLVVDNSPAQDSAAEAIVNGLGVQERVRLVRCGSNLGIAAAQNIGIKAALAEGYEFVLLSDQDSCPEPGMVTQLMAITAEREAQGEQVAAVLPQHIDKVTNQAFGFQVQRPGKWFYSTAPGEDANPWIEVLSGIASGTLSRSKVYEKVGLMREDYFIDYVDTEWFHRARALGFRLYGTAKARIGHSLGDSSFQVWYLRWRPFSAYSPQRLYYRFRNFVAMCKQPYVPFRWKLRAIWYWLGNVYAYALFANNRAANIFYIVRGLWDGVRKRSGPIR